MFYIERIYIDKKALSYMQYRVCKRWSDNESRLALELYDRGAKPAEIARIINNRFNSQRTNNAISSFLSKYRPGKRANQAINTATIQDISGKGLRGVIEDYDNKDLKDCLERRNNIIYQTLKSQADNLSEYDEEKRFDLRYRNKSLSELLALSNEEKKEVAEILIKGNGADFHSNVDLFLVSGYKDNKTSLILPLYYKDVKTSSKCLRSALNDLTLAVFLGSNNFQFNSENPRSNWFDLLKYNFTANNNFLPIRLEENINKELKKEYDASVSIYTDSSFLH